MQMWKMRTRCCWVCVWGGCWRPGMRLPPGPLELELGSWCRGALAPSLGIPGALSSGVVSEGLGVTCLGLPVVARQWCLGTCHVHACTACMECARVKRV